MASSLCWLHSSTFSVPVLILRIHHLIETSFYIWIPESLNGGEKPLDASEDYKAFQPLGPTMLVERRYVFHNRLINIVKQHHTVICPIVTSWKYRFLIINLFTGISGRVQSHVERAWRKCHSVASELRRRCSSWCSSSRFTTSASNQDFRYSKGCPWYAFLSFPTSKFVWSLFISSLQRKPTI